MVCVTSVTWFSGSLVFITPGRHFSDEPIIRPFFSEDWTEAPLVFDQKGGLQLAGIAAVALRRIGAFDRAFAVSEKALNTIIRDKHWAPLCAHLMSISSTAGELNRLALEDRLMRAALEMSSLPGFNERLPGGVQLCRYRQLSRLGRFEEAQSVWALIDPAKLSLNTSAIATHHFALSRFFQGCLTEQHLATAEARNRSVSALGVRNLCGLRGIWNLENEEWARAKASLQLAVTLAHKAGKVDRRSEIRLAFARQKLGELSDSRQFLEQLSPGLSDSGGIIMEKVAGTGL
jgi:hypothetical protein